MQHREAYSHVVAYTVISKAIEAAQNRMSSSSRPKVEMSAIKTLFTTPLSDLLAYLVLI